MGGEIFKEEGRDEAIRNEALTAFVLKGLVARQVPGTS